MGDTTLDQRNGIKPDRAQAFQVNTVPSNRDGIYDQDRGQRSGHAVGSVVPGFFRPQNKEEEEIQVTGDLHFLFDKDTPATRRDCALLEKYLKDILRNHRFMCNADFDSGICMTQTVLNINNALGRLKTLR